MPEGLISLLILRFLTESVKINNLDVLRVLSEPEPVEGERAVQTFICGSILKA